MWRNLGSKAWICQRTSTKVADRYQSMLEQSEQPTDVRVAIIGSGLAGLSMAYNLARAPSTGSRNLHVELFERHEKLGMDAESITVDCDGVPIRIDVPMRAFSEGLLCSLPRILSGTFGPLPLSADVVSALTVHVCVRKWRNMP